MHLLDNYNLLEFVIKQMMKIIRDLKMTKFGKQRFGVLCGYEGKECLIGLRPLDLHCVSIFGGISCGIPIGVDGLHMINL
jgi:hypothetical protein